MQTRFPSGLQRGKAPPMAGVAGMAALQQLDELLLELCNHVPVLLMPGASDPAGHSLPQQAMFRGLFAHTKTLSTLTLTTNPVEFTVDGVQYWSALKRRPTLTSLIERFLGTAGQNVDDLFKYVNDEDRLGLMARMLEWRHIAPTAPDTLGVCLCLRLRCDALTCFYCSASVPAFDDDPFCIKTTPHVYFVGGQPAFQMRHVNGPAGQRTLLVAVPDFELTGAVVLVDLQTLAAHVVTIRAWDA